MKIQVTQELIDAAKPRDSSHCMVADAIKAQMPDATHVVVDIQTIRYSRKGKRYVWLTPRAVAQAIVWFDRADDRLAPFGFALKGSPSQIHATGRRRVDHARTLTKRPTGQPVVHGGATPPLAALAAGPSAQKGSKRSSEASIASGRFRQYGLRGLKV